MGMNDLVRPYKKRLIIESLIRASAIGLFFGLCLTLTLAVVFRFIPVNHYGMQSSYVLIAIGAGVLCALVLGTIIYLRRYNHGIMTIAKRIDELGLEERVSTMVEYQADPSYVAKLQREDATARVSQLSTKALKIRVPKRILMGCLSVLLATLLVFTVYAKEPNPHYKKAQEVIEYIDEIIDNSNLSDKDKEALDEILDSYKDSLKEDITKEEHLELLDKIKNELEDYINQKKEIRDKLIEALKDNEITKDLADAIESQRVAEGDVIFVEKMDAAAGESVKFEQVLAVIDGETAVFGAPVIEGASVTANVVKNGKSAKVRVYKMKPKKGYRRTQGHRQPYTKVQIEAINA